MEVVSRNVQISPSFTLALLTQKVSALAILISYVLISHPIGFLAIIYVSPSPAAFVAFHVFLLSLQNNSLLSNSAFLLSFSCQQMPLCDKKKKRGGGGKKKLLPIVSVCN